MKTNRSYQILKLLDKLEILPKNLEIYNQALTHKSYQHFNPNSSHYEMLEFLGDSIINFKVSEFIFSKINFQKEGHASQLRAKSIASLTFAKICDDLQLSDLIQVGKGAKDILTNTKLKADVFESFCAAIYLDQGNEVLDLFLEKYLYDFVIQNAKHNNKDPKSEFQEKIQSFSTEKITYQSTKQSDGSFQSELIWDNQIFGVGSGKSMKEAEFNAARQALERMPKNQD
ncbi:ribonuclease III [Mesomycoplasma conjunctivae]|uniref:ribonuclease III n=1 Tax=Mesomycoplasma conjunctivae TaxID=45361 RepID=UPI003DA652EB